MYRFLVVDDDPINNMICTAVIKNNSKEFDVVCIESPIKALEYIENEYLEGNANSKIILLLDINMPIVSGWQFLEKFDQFSDGLKNNYTVYVLSSSISEHDTQKALTNKYVVGYLKKPFSQDLLNKIIIDMKL